MFPASHVCPTMMPSLLSVVLISPCFCFQAPHSKFGQVSHFLQLLTNGINQKCYITSMFQLKTVSIGWHGSVVIVSACAPKKGHRFYFWSWVHTWIVGLIPCRVHAEGNQMDVSLPHQCFSCFPLSFSFSFPLSLKIIKSFRILEKSGREKKDIIYQTALREK